jgi:acid phosphatase (class A)
MEFLRLRTIVLRACALALVASSLTFSAQTVKTATAPKAPKTPYYIDPAVMDLPALIPSPPAPDSAVVKAEFAELHQIEATRTPAQVAAAKADDAEEDMFSYTTVFGPDFNPGNLPLTADLGAHVKNEQSVAGGALKALFQRVRPYNADKSLHPVCPVTNVPNAYPSGHAFTGYLEALTLAEIAPEKRAEILARADNYAHNRLVCGVHYPSDIEASRRVAYVVFGYMLATPKFQHDLAAAKTEMQAKLKLTAD